MAKPERIIRDVMELASRPKALRFSEIERIVNQLGLVGFSVSSRPVRHGKLFTVNGEPFMVCGHTPGDSHVKAYGVRNFLQAMTTLGIYETTNDD